MSEDSQPHRLLQSHSLLDPEPGEGIEDVTGQLFLNIIRVGELRSQSGEGICPSHADLGERKWGCASLCIFFYLNL